MPIHCTVNIPADPVSADIKLETQSEDGSSVEDIPDRLSPETYHPRQALKLAISHWIIEFQVPKSTDPKPIINKYITPLVISENAVPAHVPIVPTCMVVTPTTQTVPTPQLVSILLSRKSTYVLPMQKMYFSFLCI